MSRAQQNSRTLSPCTSLSPGVFVGKDASVELETFFRKTRRMIRKEGRAPSEDVGGEIPENAFKEDASSGGGTHAHSKKGA